MKSNLFIHLPLETMNEILAKLDSKPIGRFAATCSDYSKVATFFLNTNSALNDEKKMLNKHVERLKKSVKNKKLLLMVIQHENLPVDLFLIKNLPLMRGQFYSPDFKTSPCVWKDAQINQDKLHLETYLLGGTNPSHYYSRFIPFAYKSSLVIFIFDSASPETFLAVANGYQSFNQRLFPSSQMILVDRNPEPKNSLMPEEFVERFIKHRNLKFFRMAPRPQSDREFFETSDKIFEEILLAALGTKISQLQLEIAEEKIADKLGHKHRRSSSRKKDEKNQQEDINEQSKKHHSRCNIM